MVRIIAFILEGAERGTCLQETGFRHIPQQIPRRSPGRRRADKKVLYRQRPFSFRMAAAPPRTALARLTALDIQAAIHVRVFRGRSKRTAFRLRWQSGRLKVDPGAE